MDLKSSKAMYAKAAMFLVIGFVSFGLIMVESPSLRTAVLCLLMIWAFARAYYFAFYVIEKYVDGNYRFAGLIDFAKYLLRREGDSREGAKARKKGGEERWPRT